MWTGASDTRTFAVRSGSQRYPSNPDRCRSQLCGRRFHVFASGRCAPAADGRARLPSVRADAERHARQTAIRFGVVVDAYQDYMTREGKDYKRAKSLIDKIEAFVGADRDVAPAPLTLNV